MKTALIRGKVLILSILEIRELVITGVLTAAVWYLMGAEDRYRIRWYRFQVEKTTHE